MFAPAPTAYHWRQLQGQHLIEMRDDSLISDDALREVMEELDLAEAKLVH